MALLTVASGVIIHAFVTADYTIKYVQHYSDSAMPMFYKLTSYWGGLDGSILFWSFLLSVFGAIAVFVNRERHRVLIPWVVAVIWVVQMFFLFLMVVHNNPFTTFLTELPADGRGLNPLLQNFYMVIHPPSLYTGFVAMTIRAKQRHAGRALHTVPSTSRPPNGPRENRLICPCLPG